MAEQTSQNRTVNSEEAKRAILRCFKRQRPLFLWGPPGIGKSELIESIANELDGYMIDMRMATCDPTDIRGVPFYNKETGTMNWAPPIELPTQELCDQYSVVILFLDELNSAPPAVQSACYQLILNRRVGTYRLPSNVVLVAAGNRESDKGVSYRMPTPLANRFVHLEMRVDFESWHTWAVANRIHKDVVGFISFAKNSLYDFDPKSSSRAFATPRSWTFVSQLLDDGESDSTLTDLVAGSVGEGMAVKFMAHRKLAGSLPNPIDILEGRVTEIPAPELSAQYSLVTALCYELADAHVALKGDKTGKWHTMADNYFTFMMTQFTKEITIMGARVALKKYELPIQPNKMKCFDRFHKDFGKYLLGSN